mmetsp:Transcript_25913/g.54762  ORF Transcript_25913/g.54762 Transcript_25913/m.54762 type:complete len:371 (-) Transcript_25913:57-1169(-)|eukprot:CAMPEP_0183731804 /NCGR_PEP_ID=MMETSP0737-20130205/36511_1 /TAXON_ID=385413 /ORGANISM="Thalassiosira miniscula, Strain CCMP1093" /LENGTH=370 /DNA_ID=CAMNT_0025964633 /DNA_START=40 /DNA_END=1152 /DNA_ORIENTATION=+
MRKGLLLFRSCLSWVHRGPYTTIHRSHAAPAFVSNAAGCRRPSSMCLPPVNTVRLASSSGSSFEAPEPPKSHGQPVFPDIQFSSSDDDSNAATKRNADPEAVFVVNGSSRGIGLQFVISILERSNGKVIACCRSPETAHELNNVASKYPSERIEILPLDVEDQSSIDALASNIAQNYQRVDALFNVAGILGDGTSTPGPERSLANIERNWMEKTMAVNVIGPTMLTKALSPLMRTTGRRSVKMNIESKGTIDVPLPTGRSPSIVINLSARVGSISDNQLGGWYTYRISKAALNQSTRTLGLELKRQGTWIVALHPGTTDTDLSKPFQRNVREGRLFPVKFTVDKLLDVVESVGDVNTGGFYDWAGKALPF